MHEKLSAYLLAVMSSVHDAAQLKASARLAKFNRGVLFGSLGVFTLVSGFAATMPFSQAHRDQLGCGASCIGSMTSASSLLRLVGAVVCGRLSDTLGRRSMLWLGLFGCASSLAISYWLDSLSGMWLALVPSSLLNHNPSVLKALFADYAGEAGLSDVERASAMGKLGMAIGISFMAGPLLASALASTYYQALGLAGATSALSAVFFALLPPAAIAAVAPSKDAPAHVSVLSHVRRFFHLPVLQTGGARVIIAIRLFAGLAFHVYQVIWAVSLKARFSFGPKDYGTFMGVIGFSYALSQGVVAKILIRRAGGERARRTAAAPPRRAASRACRRARSALERPQGGRSCSRWGAWSAWRSAGRSRCGRLTCAWSTARSPRWSWRSACSTRSSRRPARTSRRATSSAASSACSTRWRTARGSSGRCSAASSRPLGRACRSRSWSAATRSTLA